MNAYLGTSSSKARFFSNPQHRPSRGRFCPCCSLGLRSLKPCTRVNCSLSSSPQRTSFSRFLPEVFAPSAVKVTRRPFTVIISDVTHQLKTTYRSHYQPPSLSALVWRGLSRFYFSGPQVATIIVLTVANGGGNWGRARLHTPVRRPQIETHDEKI